MAAKKHILIDKSELVLMFLDGNTFQSINLSSNQIIRIQYSKSLVRRYLWKVSTEKIEIVTGNRAKPIEYYKNNEAQYFDEYKTDLEKFARDNRITFSNNT